MRQTVPVFLSLILLAGLLPASAEAQVIKCVKIEFTRCNCRTPYKARCIYAEGYVQWNAPVGGAAVLIKDDRGRVKETLGMGTSELRGFNLHTIHEGDAFKEKLESMGKLPHRR